MQKQQNLASSQTRLVGTALGTVFVLSAALVGVVAYAGAGRADPLPAEAPQLAQNSTMGGTALSVPEIRDCLCMEQRMTSMRADVALRQDMLNERQQELANIDQQVINQRAALQPDDTVGQQVLKDLMAQQQSLRNLLQTDLRPAYNAEASQLNDVVARYNGECVNRPRFSADVKMAQQDLQCVIP